MSGTDQILPPVHFKNGRVYMKVKLISDSTCDLSPALLEKYNIAVTPLAVLLGGSSLRDGVDIKPDDIYDFVAQHGTLPKTSAVNVTEYAEVFQYWHDRGYAVVQFNISSDFSSSYQNACIAAGKWDDVYVVDSRNLSTGQGLLVLHGAEMVQRGCSAREIYEACTALATRVEASFVIDSVDYLYKGGRCSALAALGANIFNLKPCIEVRNGLMEPGKKYRGKIEKVVLDYVTDRLSGRRDIDPHRIFITHTKCDPAMVLAVEALIREQIPDAEEVLETMAGCTVTTHCGANTLGVLFIRKP